MFVKEGAIIPMAPFAKSTFFIPKDALLLHVYTGADGSFKLYEDDGVTEKFRTKAEFRATDMQFTQQDLGMEVAAAVGSFTGAPSSRSYQVVYHGLSASTPLYLNDTLIPSFTSAASIPANQNGTVWASDKKLLNVYVSARSVDSAFRIASGASPVGTGGAAGGGGTSGGSGGAAGGTGGNGGVGGGGGGTGGGGGGGNSSSGVGGGGGGGGGSTGKDAALDSVGAGGNSNGGSTGNSTGGAGGKDGSGGSGGSSGAKEWAWVAMGAAVRVAATAAGLGATRVAAPVARVAVAGLAGIPAVARVAPPAAAMLVREEPRPAPPAEARPPAVLAGSASLVVLLERCHGWESWWRSSGSADAEHAKIADRSAARDRGSALCADQLGYRRG